MIYLASPYWHIVPAVRQFRYDISKLITVDMIRDGKFVFSPLLYTENIKEDFTEKEILHSVIKYVPLSSELKVITLDGWEQSKGVGKEIILAEKHDIPITYMDPAPFVEVLAHA